MTDELWATVGKTLAVVLILASIGTGLYRVSLWFDDRHIQDAQYHLEIVKRAERTSEAITLMRFANRSGWDPLRIDSLKRKLDSVVIRYDAWKDSLVIEHD